MTLRLSSSEYRAIVDGTDPVSARHRYRVPLTPDPDRPVADLPPEPDVVRLADWQDRLVDDEDIDRTLTGDYPPAYDRRCFGSGEL